MRPMHLKTLTLASLFGLLQLLPRKNPVPGTNPFRSSRPLVIGHRGARALYPENTLPGFQAAVDMGADMLEMDVRLTRDGQLVVHHDPDIARTSDGTGRIIDLTYEKLLEFNFGARFMAEDGSMPFEHQRIRISLLDTVFETFPDIPIIVEVKDQRGIGTLAIDEIARLLEKHNRFNRTVVASFSDANIRYMKSKEPRMSLSIGEAEVRRFAVLSAVYLDWFFDTQSTSLQLPLRQSGFELATRRFIEAIHRRNMAIHYWTINDPIDMHRLIELGADGIITDRPDLLIEVLKDMQLL